jgi:Carboxypeptidase regulatory-like domain/TonB dependent receptor
MRTLRLALMTALVFHMMCAGSPSLAASTGSIVGTVTSSEGGKTIAGAVVSAASPSGSFHGRSDAKGVFTILGVVLDTYTVSVQAQGYQDYTVQGVTVTSDEATRITAVLAPLNHLRTIGVVRARSITSAYQPDQTVDRYTVNSQGIAQLLGKNFNVDQKKLMSELPGVTVDRNGTALIRGGFSFQTAFQFEGIDYTEPNRSIGNRFQNSGNSNLLNGVNSLEIIPGGGDATHGATGTGIVALTAKRGTYPASGLIDYEIGTVGGGHQVGFEYGVAGKHLSNYFGFTAANGALQYGFYGAPASGIGASAITQDPNANSNVNAHFGALYTSAYFNTATQTSRDFLDNFIYKFGANNNQSLQFFGQSQQVFATLNYGGTNGLVVANQGQYLNVPVFGSNEEQALLAATRITTAFTGRTPGTALNSPDTIYSPFAAFKIEYDNILNATTSMGIRYFRTFNDQKGYEPDQGLYISDSGGIRTGVSADLTKSFGSKNMLQIGGSFAFAHPFGRTIDYIDYVPGYSNGFANNTVTQINLSLGGVNVAPDFIKPQPYFIPQSGLSQGTPGCTNATALPGTQPAVGVVPCGYLARYFPRGIPALPPEVEIPTANQQIYGAYLQDTYSPNRRVRALLGLRLDGYNFQLPSDPANPPAIDGVRHQRLYEPHLGLSYQMGPHDAVRANFGTTLSIPLPTFIGTNLDQSVFAAFDNIPSYDNAKGPFDPLRPSATQADYCGPGTITPTPTGGLNIIGHQPCTSYAQQLYWLQRDYRFGLQSQFSNPLTGATFTNYDLSYSHEFRDQTAVKLTPFYRRGYDVVETTRSLLGWDPLTEVAALSPPIYSNLGQQRATGVEFELTRPAPMGFSYQLSATYINQIGNDPPGEYLPTASLQLGEQYHSPALSPFQSTLGLTYRLPNGLRINPVFSYRSGYPYGNGVYQALTYNGAPVYIPLTDAVATGVNAAWISNCFVNPQNPGSVFNPNFASCRGTESTTSGPGSLRSKATLNTDVTIELSKPNTGMTYGIAITNLFNQVADVPVANVANAIEPVTTGRYYCQPGNTSTGTGYTQPVGVGAACQPYIVFPNQPPISVRIYAQMKL